MTTPHPDPSIQSLIVQLAHSDRDRLQAAKAKLKTEIIPRLKQWGVAKIHAEYSGYGDSGCIDHIAYLDQNDQPLSMDMVRSASDLEIENVLYEFLPSGFENNEGGQGDVYINVQAGTVKLEHEENYTETTSSTDQWEV